MSPCILVADDHPVVVMGIRMALSNSRYAPSITAEAVSTDELMQRLNQQHCDILIIDFSMPNGHFPDGMVLIKHIRSHYTHLKIIVMTMLSNSLILNEILKTGVHGLFDKHQPLEGLINAITRVGKGNTYISDTFSNVLTSPLRGDTRHKPLTGRELEVLRLFGQNLSGREIAEYFNRSEKTISRQKRMAMQKLGIRCNSDLTDFIRKNVLT